MKAGACIAGAVLAISVVAPSASLRGSSRIRQHSGVPIAMRSTRTQPRWLSSAPVHSRVCWRASSAHRVDGLTWITHRPSAAQVLLNARRAAGRRLRWARRFAATSGTDPTATIGLQWDGSGHRSGSGGRRPENLARSVLAPIDSEFVGLRASPPLDSAQMLLLRPVSIVDVSKRIRTPPVLSAIAFGATSIFFHDEGVYPESSGFCLPGRSSIEMTIAPSEPDTPVTLRTHCGAQPNTLTLETAGWREEIALVPNLTRDISVPVSARPGPMTLRATTTDGFVPARVEPGSTDRRLLGCWVEV